MSIQTECDTQSKAFRNMPMYTAPDSKMVIMNRKVAMTAHAELKSSIKFSVTLNTRAIPRGSELLRPEGEGIVMSEVS